MMIRTPHRRITAAWLAALAGLVLALVVLALPARADAAQFTVGVQSNNTMLDGTLTSEQRGRNLDAIRDSGARVLRVSLSWRAVASNPIVCGIATPATLRDHTSLCYDWSVYDDVIRGARTRGMDVIASIYEVPGWVNANPMSSFMGTESVFTNKVVPNWAAFQFAAASRYNSSSAIGYVRYWTVHNEPNSAVFWTPIATSAKRYPVLFRAVAPEIRAASPGALIAGGPTGPRSTIKPGKWLRDVLPALSRNGSGPFIDAWAHNPYSGLPVGPRQRGTRLPDIGISNLRDLITLLDSYPATRKKPVWATEFAWQTSPPDRKFGTSLDNQATYLAEALDIMESTGRVRIAVWYAFVDPIDILGDFQSGFYFAGGGPKPALEMFKRPVSRQVEKTKRGMNVRIWGASIMSPGSQQLLMSFNGRAWKKIPAQKKNGNGTVVANVRAVRTFWVRTKDAGGKGLARKVVVR